MNIKLWKRNETRKKRGGGVNLTCSGINVTFKKNDCLK